MAADKDVNFSVGAESSQVDREFERLAQASMTTGQRMQSAMREASNRMQAGLKENTDKMNASFDGLKGKIEALRGQLAAVAAVVVAGRFLKGAADDSNALTQESVKLGRQLGITATEARVMLMTLGDVQLSTEQLTGAHARIQQTLLTNEDAFKKLGVATRDSNGNFRNAKDIMLETNSALAKFKEGTDRNIEGMKIYGKQWGEMNNLVNLTPKAFDDARAKAEALGLAIGQENVEASNAYIAAMDNVTDVLTGVKKVIGDAVMPILTQLGDWFYSFGSNIVTGFKVSVGILASLFWGLRMSVEIVIEAIMLQFERLSARIGQVLSITMRVIQGDWSGAKTAWDKGQKELENINQQRFDNIAKKAEDTRDKIFNLFSGQTAVAPGSGGGATSSGGGDDKKTSAKAVNRSSEWEARLQDMRNAFAQEQLQLGTAHEYGKAAERDYWKNILDTVSMSQEERRAVLGKYIALEQELRKTAFDQQIADMQADLAATASGGMERIRIAAEIAAEVGRQYGLESEQYRQSLGAVQQAARDHQAQMAQIEQMGQERRRVYQLGQLEMERVNLDQQLAMGDISNQQRLVQLMALKEQEYQIELQAAMDRAALLENDAIAYQAAMDKVLEIKRQHELDKRNIENEMAQQSKADWEERFAPISSAFQKSINGMIQGTTTLRDATRNLLLSIASEYAAMGVRMVVQWAANETRKTMATSAGATARTGIEATAAAASTATSAQSTIVSIMNDAYEAMAGAYSAIAGIPFVGPFLAPAVAAGAFTVVAGLAGSVASAEGGYNIPGGVNPLTQLHEREMVLPAEHADVIRALAERGGAGGGQAPIVLKGVSSDEFFIANRKQLTRALKLAGRDFMN